MILTFMNQKYQYLFYLKLELLPILCLEIYIMVNSHTSKSPNLTF